MAIISITIEDEEVKRLLKLLQSRYGNLKPVLSNIGEYLRFRAEENFKLEQDPEGVPWAPLSPKYAKRKAQMKAIQKKLQFTGDLRASLAYNATSTTLEIGTSRKVGSYSLGAIHQLGAPRRNIPARPFLGIGQQDREAILAILEAYLTI